MTNGRANAKQPEAEEVADVAARRRVDLDAGEYGERWDGATVHSTPVAASSGTVPSSLRLQLLPTQGTGACAGHERHHGADEAALLGGDTSTHAAQPRFVGADPSGGPQGTWRAIISLEG